jgi:hypothetical protein
MQRLATVIIAVVVLAVAGCATAPTPEIMRAETANYQLPQSPDANSALVYVVRPSPIGGLIRFNVFLGDQQEHSEMGFTRGSQYIYFAVPPGEHKIYSKAENWAEVAISVKAGQVIFLQQDATMGLIMARNNLSMVEDYQGKYYVKTLSAGTILKTQK